MKLVCIGKFIFLMRRKQPIFFFLYINEVKLKCLVKIRSYSMRLAVFALWWKTRLNGVSFFCFCCWKFQNFFFICSIPRNSNFSSFSLQKRLDFHCVRSLVCYLPEIFWTVLLSVCSIQLNTSDTRRFLCTPQSRKYTFFSVFYLLTQTLLRCKIRYRKDNN